MTPEEAIEAGRKILDQVMVAAGFAFLLGPSGKGSGGHFASASYFKDDRRLVFSYRWALGAVEYYMGEEGLDHNSYMRLLGVYGESEFCRSSAMSHLLGLRRCATTWSCTAPIS